MDLDSSELVGTHCCVVHSGAMSTTKQLRVPFSWAMDDAASRRRDDAGRDDMSPWDLSVSEV